MQLLRNAILLMQQRMTHTWERDLRGRIQAETGIRVVCEWEELSEDERVELQRFFRSNIYPILTPLVVDPGHPFPFISHLSLSLAIVLRDPRRETDHFARVKLPLNRGRWVRFGEGLNFISIETLIAQHIAELFRE